MPTLQKRVPSPPVRKPRNSADSRPAKRHPAPTSPGEKHIGATEDQVSVTMPPRENDDEPKQG
jgi:hypothetical protein